MSDIEFTDGNLSTWQHVATGVEKVSLRSKPGENRVLLRISPGKEYPTHEHAVPDEVFVVEGIYVDPGVEGGKEFGPGSYLYYPAGTVHTATSVTGCTILVWNSAIAR